MRRMAAALEEEPLSDDEVGMALRLARRVAHGVERKDAPLASYLAGVRAGRLAASGTDRTDAFRRVMASVEPLIPEPGPDAERS
jgi:Domain of unknown function (DUF6457)